MRCTLKDSILKRQKRNQSFLPFLQVRCYIVPFKVLGYPKYFGKWYTFSLLVKVPDIKRYLSHFECR